ncbi:unnamed protein product, partial [marine sediment metagenome]
WETELFTIYFSIKNQPAGWYDVNITCSGNHVSGSPLQIHKSQYETAYDFCDVPDPGTYHVTIKMKNGGIIYNNDVTIYWPNGPPSEEVRV